MGCAVPVYAADLKTSDTIYNPLPLYHSSAGILCCGPSFYIGLSVALKKKFSAKEYWKDCVKYNATVIILDNFMSDLSDQLYKQNHLIIAMKNIIDDFLI